MKCAAAFLAVVLALPFPAAAREDSEDEISCGVVENRNTSWQVGELAWVEFIVETRRAINACPLSVAVDAWVAGVDGSAISRYDAFTASARRQVPVPYYGSWQVNGNHWRIWFSSVWYHNGSTGTQVSVRPSTRRDPAYECFQMGGTWNDGRCELANSPLLVDTLRDGYRLTSVDEGVRFDLDADGTPEQVAWTEADSDDAWLAMDRNGNGRIDDGSELFGNHTRAYANRADPTASNGFEALGFAQGPTYGSSHMDSQIDARDAVFSRLLLWRDRNHNGISEAEELEPVSASELRVLSTDYKTSKRVDRHGNEFRQRAKAVWADGESSYVYDVWLKSRH